ncbi:MAG TPA: TetR/AcrR family transcriptional regulator [Candidatus Bathyarchaeia archaeon]|nr:TetR/AcrR family transcriptional regulator [Candidatus Bathyarchaeia archaeon]
MSSALSRITGPPRGRPPTVGLRGAILRSAESVFSGHEFHAAAMDDIARRCGVGKGTLYRYFSSKDDLFLAVVREGLERLRDELHKRVDAPGSTVEKLTAIVRGILAHFWERPFLLVLIHREENKGGAAGRSWLRRRGEIVRLIQRVIEEGIAARQFRKVDSRLASEMLLGMVRAMNRYRSTQDRLEELVANVIGLLVAGIGADDTARRAGGRER